MCCGEDKLLINLHILALLCSWTDRMLDNVCA